MGVVEQRADHELGAHRPLEPVGQLRGHPLRPADVRPRRPAVDAPYVHPAGGHDGVEDEDLRRHPGSDGDGLHRPFQLGAVEQQPRGGGRPVVERHPQLLLHLDPSGLDLQHARGEPHTAAGRDVQHVGHDGDQRRVDTGAAQLHLDVGQVEVHGLEDRVMLVDHRVRRVGHVGPGQQACVELGPARVGHRVDRRRSRRQHEHGHLRPPSRGSRRCGRRRPGWPPSRPPSSADPAAPRGRR